MKKIILLVIIAISFFTYSYAGERDRITVNAGFLFPKTLNATVGYELELKNGSAIEAFGELGNQWQSPTCHRFWDGYFWDGGAMYKYQLKRYKNGNFRIFGGGQFGATQTKFFLGIRAGFEYNYIFSNNWEFSIQQLNTVNFIHGRTFRNGLMIGLKVPL